jgi:hypothetical protein
VARPADAPHVDRNVGDFADAALVLRRTAQHDESRLKLMHQVRMKLCSAEIMIDLNKPNLPDADLTGAKEVTQAALSAIRPSNLGHAILCAAK